MKFAWLSASLACAAALTGFALAQPAPPEPSLTPPTFGTWGLDLAGRDLTVKPGDDFDRYSNGRYLDQIQIPPDRTGWGVNYELSALSEAQVRAILEEKAKAGGDGEAGKIGRFYAAFMDEARVEGLGAKPLQPWLARTRAAKSKADIAAIMGTAPKDFPSAIFNLYIDADPKDPDRYAINLFQGGLGLPDRDYYLAAQFADKKAKYQAYVADMLRLAGWPDPAGHAKAIVALETKIARVSWTKAQERDPVKTYNPMSPAALAKLAPGFPWKPFLAAADLGSAKRLIVSEKSAFPKIAAVFAATPLDTLKAWVAFNLADNAAPYLSKAFTDARFEFRSKTLSGQLEQRPRWKRAVAAVDGAMGEAVGRIYVERHFPPEAQAKIEALVDDLKVAFRARLQNLAWMDAKTKAEALKKLGQFHVKVGHPTKWRDYSKLSVDAGDLFDDVARGQAFEWDRVVARLNQPVDKDEWGMTPQTANAYYNPTMNEIVFPAAELQAPFFDPKADAAVNYGGIGSVIGHEMTHGFDDEGRKSDGEGRLRDWWTPGDVKKFEVEARKLGAQYSAYQPLPGAHVNGELTMGENIADLGGLLIALDAYRVSLKGTPPQVRDGLTGDQRFFLSYGQAWRDKVRDEALRQQLVSDPHSPEAVRVNGVVRNIDDWYAAFSVRPGDKLYLAPKERARIW